MKYAGEPRRKRGRPRKHPVKPPADRMGAPFVVRGRFDALIERRFKELGITTAQICETLGCTQTTWARFRRCPANYSVDKLAAVAEVLKVTLAELVEVATAPLWPEAYWRGIRRKPKPRAPKRENTP